MRIPSFGKSGQKVAQNRKVLWIEDDIYYCAPYVSALRENHFEVLHARDATSGLAAVEKDRNIAAVIVDMAMDPGARFSAFETRGGHYAGLALARNIHLKNKHLPIVALSRLYDDEAKSWFQDKGFPCLLKSNTTARQLIESLRRAIDPSHKIKPRCFIVHGHDLSLLNDLKAYITGNLGFDDPVVLRELASQGRTIIEKFEDESDNVSIVFVLMTPDDLMGGDLDARRARQNVIFELGYFYGKFNRREGRVILLYKDKLEIPSDVAGVASIDISRGFQAADAEIRQELTKYL